ncbi:acyl-CoA dehydrogenase family protein [Actinosynnema sp. NPDC020468]|uniref:acyl-CoA dehydrogenase family protein n=1 Tax=Actinosynnema sp. NPDC020468 TaxID=3154488 RepID=UPI0033CCCA06
MISLAAVERAFEDDPGAWSPEVLAEADEREEFPVGAVEALDALGVAAHYVLGPDCDFPRSAAVLRAVARRDLTVAIAHGKTFLGSAPVWVAGSAAQVDGLAERVRGGASVCLALSEPEHGADLLAGEVTATPVGRGWSLDGEKWPINNGTRGDLATVLARTDPAGGGRGFGVFLVDRAGLADGAWRCLPKARTHGIRGADISGFALRDAVVGPEALVGGAGDGVAVVLKALQITRIACTSLSLGAADHALRLAVRFVAGRRLYGRTLADLPHARRTLGRVVARVLAAEAVALVATRSVHASPDELGVVSAVAKAFVPTTVQDALGLLAELLGSRGFLVEPDGFAKVERDHRVVGIFDGSTVVNRTLLLTQLPRLGRLLARRRYDADGVRAAVAGDLPPFDRDRLTLVSATGCAVVQSLPDAVDRVRAHPLAPEGLLALTGPLLAEADAVRDEAIAFTPTVGGLPAAAYRLAERYENLFAAAACLHRWLAHVDHADGPLWTDARWVRGCLAHLLDRPDDAVSDALARAVLDHPGALSDVTR